jgi:signal transduction histidine kinase
VIESEVSAPELQRPLFDRVLARLGLRDDIVRIVAATPSLRVPWILAAGSVVVFALWGASVEPRLAVIVAMVAPVLPVAGVAAAYGPWADPMFEMTQASPVSGFRVLVIRSLAVVAVAVVLVGLAATVVPGAGVTAIAWVLPSLALCSASLLLATVVPLTRAVAIVAIAWFAVAAGAAVTQPAAMFRGWAQVAFCAVAIGCSLLLARRRHHLDIANLHTRRALVDAGDAERRRIERNIHDGAQQQLVAIGVKAGLARALVTKDPPRAGEVLDQIRADAQAALEALRDMTRGAYPPVLADGGLAAALALKARDASVPVRIDAAGIGRLPKEVEVAAYFCCTEAMQNAEKYAKASSIAITVRAQVGTLAVSVIDDGVGFDLSSVRRGVGMRSMAERVESLGGTLQVRSALGTGTAISVTIPLPHN